MQTQRLSRTSLWRSSIVATLTFVALFTLIGVGGTVRSSGPPLSFERLALLVGVAIYLAIPVFACCLLLGVLLMSASQRTLRWEGSVVLGVLFSLIPMVIGILMFRDGDDPKRVLGYIQFWQRVPTAFVLGVLPYLVSGAVLGLLFGRPGRSSQE